MMPTWVWKLSWGRLKKVTMTSDSTSTLKKASPSAFTLKPDNSVFPHISLMSFKLLPQGWISEQVSPSSGKFMHGSLERKFCDSFSLSFQSQSLLIFISRSYRDFIFYHGNPHWRSWYVSKFLALAGGPLHLRYSTDTQLPHVDMGPAHFISPPLFNVSRCPLFCVPSYRTSFQLHFQ